MITGLLYDCIFLIPFSFVVFSWLRPLIESRGMINGAAEILLISALIIFLLFRHLKKRGRAVLSGIMAALLSGVIIMLPPGKRLETVREGVWVPLILFMALFSTLIILLSEKKYFLKAVLSLMAAAGLIISIYTARSADKLTVMMTFLFILAVFADGVQRYSKKTGDTEVKKHLAGTAVFLICPFILISFIRIPDTPYDWGFVKKITETVRSGCILLSESFQGGSPWDRESDVIGFSEKAGPGGNLRMAEHTVMEIDTHLGSDPVIYLKGKTFDSFDGHMWDSVAEEDGTFDGMDTIETLGSVISPDDEYDPASLFRMGKLSVRYKDMRTERIFFPEKTLSLSRKDKENYSLDYFRINRDSPGFMEYASEKKDLSEEMWEEARKEYGSEETPNYEGYLKYRENIEKTCLPGTGISERAREYADRALKDKDTDYEKLCALEGLFADFKYTESPGDIPESVKSPEEFLDYFLFEKREGYCSYFATAFVLLSREYGIPSRYVQGYKVEAEGSHEKVGSEDAHAWAESYLKGKGWFIFEATPGFRHYSVFGMGETAAPGYGKTYISHGENGEASSGEVEPENNAGEGTKIRISWYKILIPVLSGLLLTLLMLLIDRILKKIRYDRMSETEKGREKCRAMMELLKRKGLEKEEGETLSEYGERLEKLLPGGAPSFLHTYEKILYSGHEIGKEERSELEEESRNLKRALRRPGRRIMI